MAGSSSLPAVLGLFIEEATRRYLALAKNGTELLAPLAGRLIELRLLPFDYRLYLAPTESALTWLPEVDTRPDATLSGTPLAFVRMGLSGRPQRGLFAGEIVMAGDVSVAHRFQALLRKLDIDWEAHLARFTGTSFAGWLTETVKTSRNWAADSLESLQLDVAEYLQEESRELPTSAEAEDFYRDVDVLRGDFDRLFARLERLEAGLAQPRS